MIRPFAAAALALLAAGPRPGSAAPAAAPPPAPAPVIAPMQQMPGLYRVASQGGLVCDVFLVAGPDPVLIDCGSAPGWDQLTASLAALGVRITDIRWVIATHGHWDHVDAMERIRRASPGTRFAIHAGDAQSVITDDRVFSCAEPLYRGVPSEPIHVDRILLDGDVVQAGRASFRIIHTPGHTPGSITVVTEIDGKRVGFCGDSVTGYYSATNRSSLIDWENSMRRLMREPLDVLYAGHRKKPVLGPVEIRAYLERSLASATAKRAELAREENYEDLVYRMEHNAEPVEVPSAPVLGSAGILAGLEKAPSRQDREALAAAVIDAGLRWTRQTFEWRVVEAVPGTLDWTVPDAAVAAARRRHLDILGVLLTTPFGHAPATPAELDRFGAYVTATVERYRKDVHVWEVWNEPNLRMFWGPKPDPAAYAAALKVAYRAAKAADPTCRIAAMSTLGSDVPFIRGALEAGAAACLDILAVHPYRDLRDMDLANDRPDLTMREDTGILRRLLASFGRDVPIWFTEMGRNTSLAPEGEGVSPAEQADYTVKMHVMALATGVERVFQYELWAPASTPENKEWHYGVLNADRTPKPAYGAIRTLAARIGGMAYAGSAAAEDGRMRAYAFTGGTRAVVVAWAVRGPAVLTLPTGGARLRVADRDGRERPVPADAGCARIALTTEPVYVEGLKPGAAARLCALDVRAPWAQARPGEWITVPCRIANPLDHPVSLTVRAEAPGGGEVRAPGTYTAVAPRASVAADLRVRIPHRARAGEAARVRVTLQIAGGGGDIRVSKALCVPVDPGWLVCGPFPNPGPDGPRAPGAPATDTGLGIDHLAALGGEAAIEPTEGQEARGALGGDGTTRWTRFASDVRGFVDLRHAFAIRRSATAYAVRRVYSDRARTAAFRVGSDDGIRVWLNHREVFANHVHREAHPGQDAFLAPLRRGWNTLLIKVDQGSWGWGAYVEIEDDGPAFSVPVECTQTGASGDRRVAPGSLPQARAQR